MNGHGQKRHTYFIIAKFSSESEVVTEDAEHHVMKALKDLDDGIDVEIVQLGHI